MNASATAARREQLQATVAAGATIVHSFHVDGVRTILPTLAVLSLVATRVRGVTVPQDYSISAFVDFRDAIDPQATVASSSAAPLAPCRP